MLLDLPAVDVYAAYSIVNHQSESAAFRTGRPFAAADNASAFELRPALLVSAPPNGGALSQSSDPQSSPAVNEHKPVNEHKHASPFEKSLSNGPSDQSMSKRAASHWVSNVLLGFGLTLLVCSLVTFGILYYDTRPSRRTA